VARAARRLVVIGAAGSAYTSDGVEVFFRASSQRNLDVDDTGQAPRDGLPITDKFSG